MQNSPNSRNLPALPNQRTTAVVPSVERRAHGKSEGQNTHDAYEHDDQPEVETIIDSSQIKEKIIDYLGAVLARCWYDHDLLNNIAKDAHSALRQVGIFLPPEIDIKVERENKSRPRLVIYEYNASRTFRKRICYLQLVMMAGA